ncbi:MAG: class I SAM-dependent methyltransferase [Bacteroidota bacterium]|jgi:demethylmenaquinone methyltransferase/2-methoxy-6-polyprenyl-1,4-benzoquinol methylase
MITKSESMNARQTFFDKVAINWSNNLTAEEESSLRGSLSHLNLPTGANGQLLDIGCGTGILFPYIMEWQVTALDISDCMLKKARQNNPGNVVAFVQADAEALPFEDNRFDCAVLFSVFPHFDRPVAVLQEIRRVIKPGGKIAIIHVKPPEAINAIHISVGGAIVNDRLPQLSELEEIMITAGFEIAFTKKDSGLCLVGRKT